MAGHLFDVKTLLVGKIDFTTHTKFLLFEVLCFVQCRFPIKLLHVVNSVFL
jgi:hypothetical protein